MVLREACSQCGSTLFKRNGHIHSGQQNHRCKRCGRAFVLRPENSVITEAQRRSLSASFSSASRYGESAGL